MKRRKQFILQIAVTVVFLIFMFPYLWMVISAFKTRLQVFAYPPVWFFKPTLENFRVALQENNILFYLKNSFIVSGGNTLLSLALALPASYSLARGKFKFKELLGYFFLIVQMVPAISVVFAYFYLAKVINLYDTKIMLIIIYLLWQLPWAVWMTRGFIEGVPPSLEEAASIDGCSRVGILIRIILPLIAPGLAAAAVFVFIMSWNEFTVAFLLTSRDAATIPTRASQYITHLGVLWGPMFATATIATFPAILFSIIFRKYMISALTMGAVKE